MKEWFLQPEDGEEFKVFYLGNGSLEPNKPNKDIHEHGVSGCCPIGPKGEVGETGIPEPLTGTTLPPSDAYNFSLDPTLGGVWNEAPIGATELPSSDEKIAPEFYAKSSPTDEQKDKFIEKLFTNPLLKKIYGDGRGSVEIDDTIESDIITEPKAGRVYKVRGLNMLVRFVSTHLSVVGIGGHPSDIFEVEYHGTHYYFDRGNDMLLKATALEVELYLDNE